MEGCIAVRKGAWTEEEDNLLRQHVEKHGEGKWNQVPSGAGLNRCRKSCRMRWLNYLRPNIKKGGFAADEVDLMIKLHELLGNRWSLIAGRLPGRTANDVKNYWNTYLRKKEIPRMKDPKAKAPNVGKVNLIKPQPRTVPKNWTWLSGKFANARDFEQENDINNTPPTLMSAESNSKWWESLLDHKAVDEEVICTVDALNDKSNDVLSADRIPLETEVGNTFYEDGLNFMADSYFDASLWDLLDAE